MTATLPSPPSSADLEQDLTAAIAGEVRFDPASRALYATDASVYQLMPSGVVIPRDVDDVATVVAACRRYGSSITARGGGTSQAGQAIGTGIQLDFSKYLNRVLEFAPDRRRVRVQPGIVLDELNALLKPYGLTLPLDLSTSDRATIGGMIANNSSGTRSVIYGKTLDYVERLRVILADGSMVDWHDLDDDQLAARVSQDSLDGRCHEVVQRLATRHAEEIEQRYPKILRRVGGYNLDEFVPGRGRPFNLSRMLVGSEGTLGLVLEATLRVVPLPAARAMLSIQFSDLLDALGAIPAILEHHPSAVELLDRFILSHTAGKPEFEPLRSFIEGDPAAVLLAEVQGDEPAELVSRIDRLVEELQRQGLGQHTVRVIDPAEQARIWKLRRAALGLSMSRPGDSKAISFVEDTAVDPGRLREYIERFREILARHDTDAGFYAHASVGLLHIRPIVDLKTTTGVERFAAIADEVADLVLEFGGALSGEHGDGLVRAPFQERMYGPELYQAFRELKATFDSEGLLNPGKIVDAGPLTDSLRFGAGTVTAEPATAFDFSDFGGIARAAEQCGGVGACRKTLTGTMCPSYMATRDEADSTRGRANALRMALAGDLGDSGLADPALKPVFELCLECKACKAECPTGVDMARLKSEFLHQYHRRHRRPRGDRLIAGTERWLRRAGRWPRLANALAGSASGRWLAELLAGIDRRRRPPTLARQNLLDWWGQRNQSAASGDPVDLVLFPDTFSTWCEPRHVIAATEIAERLGRTPALAERVCCGRPLISKGFLDQASAQAVRVIDSLAGWARADVPIVFLEPSCWSAVRDDLPRLVPSDRRAQAEQVAASCVTFEDWAAENIDPAALAGSLAAQPVIYHGHCHHKALVGSDAAVSLLSRVPGSEVTALDSGCCGMAGSFGYERDHYDVSRTIAERVLVPAIRECSDGTAVIAPGFSCRHQVEHFTGVRPLSTAEWLCEVMGVEEMG